MLFPMKNIMRKKYDVVILMFYTILSILYWWPLSRHFMTHELHAGPIDPAFNKWIIGWGAHALTHYPWRFFEANMFWPNPHVLAWGDHLFGITIFAIPLIKIFGLIGAYNILLISSTALSGFTMYLLAKHLLNDRGVAVVGGVIWCISFSRIVEAEHIQILWIQWVPLLLLFADLLRTKYRRRYWWGLLISSFAVASTGIYLALQAAICFGCYLILDLGINKRKISELRPQLTAFSIGLFIAAPLYVPSFVINFIHPTVRGFGEMNVVHLKQLIWPFSPPGKIYELLTHQPANATTTNMWSIGILATLGVIIGAILLVTNKLDSRGKKLFLVYVSVALIAFMAAMGPYITWDGIFILPNFLFLAFYKLIPGYTVLRFASRWYYFGLIGVSICVGLSLNWITKHLSALFKYALLACVIIFVVIEQNPGPRESAPSYRIRDSEIYSWLASQHGEFPILEMPIYPAANPATIEPLLVEGKRQILSTYHWKKRVGGGISPVIPGRYGKLAGQLNALGDDPAAITQLKSIGVKYVLFIPDDYATFKWDRSLMVHKKYVLDHQAGLTKMHEFKDGTVYKVD